MTAFRVRPLAWTPERERAWVRTVARFVLGSYRDRPLPPETAGDRAAG